MFKFYRHIFKKNTIKLSRNFTTVEVLDYNKDVPQPSQPQTKTVRVNCMLVHPVMYPK